MFQTKGQKGIIDRLKNQRTKIDPCSNYIHNRINGNDRAARAEPSRLELCQVVMEEDDSQNERKHGNNLTYKYLNTDDSD